MPGSGQAYSGHYADALIAFFVNAVFIAATFTLYDLELSAKRPHYASITMGVLGLGFLCSKTLAVGIQSANRYNNFKERQFHQQIRNDFFNTEYVEKVSETCFQKCL